MSLVVNMQQRRTVASGRQNQDPNTPGACSLSHECSRFSYFPSHLQLFRGITSMLSFSLGNFSVGRWPLCRMFNSGTFSVSESWRDCASVVVKLEAVFVSDRLVGTNLLLWTS